MQFSNCAQYCSVYPGPKEHCNLVSRVLERTPETGLGRLRQYDLWRHSGKRSVERIDVSILVLRGDWMLFFQENVEYVREKQICTKVSVNFVCETIQWPCRPSPPSLFIVLQPFSLSLPVSSIHLNDKSWSKRCLWLVVLLVYTTEPIKCVLWLAKTWEMWTRL